MKKAVVLLAILILTTKGYSQLFTFTFNGTGACPTQGSSLGSQPANATVSTVSRVGTLVCSSTNDCFNSTGWTTSSSIDLTQYVEVTISAAAGYTVNCTGIGFTTLRSSTGPTKGRISHDGGTGTFSTSSDFTDTTISSYINWSFSSFSGSTGGMVKFRIYGWNASSSSGSMRLDDLFVNATVTATSPITIDYVNGLVGISKTPGEKLDINGNLKTTGFILPTGAGLGKILRSDSNGVASWVSTTTIVGNPTLQQVIDNGNRLTKNDTINASNHNLLLDSINSLKINSYNLAIGIEAPGGQINSSGVGSMALGLADNGQINSSGNGSIAVGNAVDSSQIIATGTGSFTIGSSIAHGTMNSTGEGSAVKGFVDHSSMTASGDGSFAIGMAVNSGQINSSGHGAIASGYANTGQINSYSPGSFAMGSVLYFGQINAIGEGTIATGKTVDSAQINSTGDASFSHGFAENGSQINANGTAGVTIGSALNNSQINANGEGSVGLGYVNNNGLLLADAPGSVVVGYSDNDTLSSLGSGSFVTGRNNQNSGNYSMLIGRGLRNDQENVVKLGYATNYNISITDKNNLYNSIIEDSVLTTDSTGKLKLKYITISSTNGITYNTTSNKIEFGGTLIKNTTVALDTNNLYFTSSDTSLGNVGINTSSIPLGYKLAVNGNIIANKLTIKPSEDWADYVFDSSYNLLDLAEVENFIKTNKHLPGIPTTKDVEKTGLDVGSNQATLLKKIEELTLYSIELEKKNATQDKKSKEQQEQIDNLIKRLAALEILIGRNNSNH